MSSSDNETENHNEPDTSLEAEARSEGTYVRGINYGMMARAQHLIATQTVPVDDDGTYRYGLQSTAGSNTTPEDEFNGELFDYISSGRYDRDRVRQRQAELSRLPEWARADGIRDSIVPDEDEPVPAPVAEEVFDLPKVEYPEVDVTTDKKLMKLIGKIHEHMISIEKEVVLLDYKWFYRPPTDEHHGSVLMRCQKVIMPSDTLTFDTRWWWSKAEGTSDNYTQIGEWVGRFGNPVTCYRDFLEITRNDRIADAQRSRPKRAIRL